MEIPYNDGQIFFKRYPVSRGYSAESVNALTVQATGIFVKRIIIEVIKETCHIHRRIGDKILSCRQGGHKAEKTGAVSELKKAEKRKRELAPLLVKMYEDRSREQEVEIYYRFIGKID